MGFNNGPEPTSSCYLLAIIFIATSSHRILRVLKLQNKLFHCGRQYKPSDINTSIWKHISQHQHNGRFWFKSCVSHPKLRYSNVIWQWFLWWNILIKIQNMVPSDYYNLNMQFSWTEADTSQLWRHRWDSWKGKVVPAHPIKAHMERNSTA
jgi:hypothetical protein